jgi:hypothetical protein
VLPFALVLGVPLGLVWWWRRRHTGVAKEAAPAEAESAP